MAVFLPKCCDSTRVDEARKSFSVVEVSDGGSVSYVTDRYHGTVEGMENIRKCSGIDRSAEYGLS